MHPPQLLFFALETNRFLDEAAEKWRRMTAVQRKGGNHVVQLFFFLINIFGNL